jgi:predicted DNA-binding protein YlxM (UPF0122 family)
MDRQAIYNEIKKVIEECTDYNGRINAVYLKKQILINVFPEITDDSVIK